MAAVAKSLMKVDLEVEEPLNNFVVVVAAAVEEAVVVEELLNNFVVAKEVEVLLNNFVVEEEEDDSTAADRTLEVDTYTAVHNHMVVDDIASAGQDNHTVDIASADTAVVVVVHILRSVATSVVQVVSCSSSSLMFPCYHHLQGLLQQL